MQLESSSTSLAKPMSYNKLLVKILDVLGQEVAFKKNIPLLYLYDDGSVEKKIIIE